MGYSTNFAGVITVNPPLNEHEISYLQDFADTRHTSNTLGYLAISLDQNINGNTPQGSKPGIWCNWVPTDDGNLEWSESEKTYHHAEWLIWLIQNLLGPNARKLIQAHIDDDPRLQHFTYDHICNGIVDADGEESYDFWRIKVVDNEVTTHIGRITYDD